MKLEATLLHKGVELGIGLIAITTLILTGCGGGGSGNSSATNSTPGFTFTASAGVGEVIQIGVNTTNLTYSYSVTKTSYAASGVSVGKNGGGNLTNIGNGFYSVGSSADSFIQSGKIFPIQNGLIVGHVLINTIGGTNKIPVFGLSNPITTLAGLAGTYNFEGFSCTLPGIANVNGNANCAAHYGTMTVDATGGVVKCGLSDITASSGVNYCNLVQRQNRHIQAITASPGVYDVSDATPSHVGWFFAFTAPNGQKVAVIDHDDPATLAYGHTVLSTYAPTTLGSVDGNYLVKNNEGAEHLVTISGVNITNLTNGYTGSITYNSPWSGMSTYQMASGIVVSSGVAMVAGTGAYTHVNNADTALFAIGLKY